jgi:HAD superfamily hydrolase (TIGR01509 family)
MSELTFDPTRLKALVFDLDGTLYRQEPLRRAMLVRLLRAHALHPLAGARTMRLLSAYRKAQEHLRMSPSSESGDLAAAQIRLACEWSGAQPEFATACVARWMEQEPLPILACHPQPGALEFLHACRQQGLRLGLLSDYPAHAKLSALGLDDLFDVVLTAQSADVGVFKPDPRGLLLVIERLGVSPSESMYVGDRAEVDASAAAAAGVPCAILSRRTNKASQQDWLAFSSYPRLHELVLGQRSKQSPTGSPQPRLHHR